ncbi:MAG: aryl-sulfate sulfotransferase [Anaerolineales bacterium]|nr:aryl-sulfate sulfotransferase [Chloroflexota bacterium]MBL6983399.1 aryl-sulfate sulfotransferase [Anaerolineales bacterium]
MKKTIFAIPIILLSILILACTFAETFAGQTQSGSDAETRETSQNSEFSESNQTTLGNEELTNGVYLFSPITSTDTYLMDADGAAVYTWTSDYSPGHSVYLLENGNLLRTGKFTTGVFDAGGSGGIVQEIAPDSTIVWEYQYASEQVQQHHDIEQMPNGNILMIAWEYKTKAEAILAGRDPNLLKDGELWPDHIVEVDPTTNQIVWEWHTWDHLVQDYHPTRENYGVVAEHPELIDVNFTSRQSPADWNHTNAIDYNAELDQILLSVHNFSEIWIIDHNTTTEKAAGPAGDLLYRWGNPQAYDAGTATDQQLYVQHDARWIPSEYPGEGYILVFNNGDRNLRAYSSIDEIVTPINPDGSYTLTSGSAFGPEAPIWSFMADNPTDFYADHVSGAQRLSNGNTLICDGVHGIFFEVTPDGETVWSYVYGGDVFRVTQIASNYPGLTFLNLQSGETLKGEPRGTGGTQGPSTGSGQDNQRHQKAVEACFGLTESAACTIQNPNKTVSGSCQIKQSELACVPENRP